tara:strand:- start:1630 stop:2166 length:537 start_codon:yes stop_codon:yes gene_type:complete
MIKNFKFIIVVLLGLFIFFILFEGLDKQNNYSPKKISTKIENNFKARKLYENKEVSLNELIKKYDFTILNIWSSWCLPCRNEHSYLMNLQRMKNLNIIGINYKDKDKNAKKFLAELGNPYSEILVDSDGTKSIELGAYGVPETYLINGKTKKIIKKFIGPLDDLKFQELLETIKNEKN